MEKNNVLMSWSTGKDSAYTLFKLKQLPHEVEAVGLLTTLTKSFDRTCLHGVRRQLLEAQIQRLGLRPYVLEIPYPCANEDYDSIMKTFLSIQAVAAEITHIAFGDLFLENIRQYRETQLSKTSIKPLFPLWHQNTSLLANEIIDAGFKAIITCIDPKKLDISFAGRLFDKNFLADLPEGIDPCGENGEFHTFVYDTPLFSTPIDITVGTSVERNGFIFLDIELDE